MSPNETSRPECDRLKLAVNEMQSLEVGSLPPALVERTSLAVASQQAPANARTASRWRKFAASVFSTAAVALVIWIVARPNPKTVFADVVKNALQSKSVSFVQQVTGESNRGMEVRVQVKGDKMRCEFSHGFIWIEDSAKRQGIVLDVAAKEAARREFDLGANKSRLNTDPMQWLRRLRPGKSKWLGERIVDGHSTDLFSGSAQGVFTKGTGSYGFAPDHDVRIWVDRATDLPRKIEIHSPQGRGVIVFRDIEWQKAIENHRFSLDVPNGYKFVPYESLRRRFPQSTAQDGRASTKSNEGKGP